MRLEQLEFLVAAADCHSITLASHKLHTSQQNISRAIRQLEEELQTQLLKRSKKGVNLTPEGEGIYAHAQAIMQHIALINSTKPPADERDPTLTGQLEIISLPGFYSIIFDVVKVLNKRYPHLEIKRIEQEAAAINNRLPALANDIIFTAFPESSLKQSQALLADYDVYLLKTEPLKLIGSIHSPLTAYKKIALSKLSTLPLIVYYSDTEQTPLFVDILKAHHITPKNIIKTSTPAFCSDHILDGTAYYFGTTYLLSISDKCHSAALHSVALAKNINMCYVMLTRKAARSPQADVFIDAFCAYYDKQLTRLTLP